MASEYIDKHQRALAFFISFSLLLLIQWQADVDVFPYDSGVYWELSDPEVFFAFPEHYRGYFMPMLLLPAHWLSLWSDISELYAFRVYASLLYAFTIALVVPAFYCAVFGGRVTFSRRMLFFLLVTTIFPGIFVYPLSDMPALALLIGAILLVERPGQQTTNWRLWWRLAVAGLIVYGAYNTRSIYFFSLPIFLAMVLWRIPAHGDVAKKCAAILALVLGMLIAAVPQSIINYRHTGSYSPLLSAQSSDDSLFGRQLIWGLSIQRYSTHFDPETGTGSGLYSIDPAGIRLFNKEQITADDANLKGYISLVLKYPFHFIGTYTRHLVNGIDVRDGEVYVRDPLKRTNARSFFGFFILFVAAWVVIVALSAEKPEGPGKNASARRSLQTDVLPPLGWLTVLLFPVAAIVPGAVETRFFLGLHCLAYMTLAFSCRPHLLLENFKAHRWSIVSVFVIALLVFNTITIQSIVMQQRTIDPKYMLMD